MLSRPKAIALLLAAGELAPGDAGFAPALPGHVWSFPRDHFSHPGYRNEWWYFTGTAEAEGEPGRRFGYQVTFFRVGLSAGRPAAGSAWAARDVLMGHAAVTDLATGAHRFSEVLYRAAPILAGFGEPPDPRLAWSLGPPGTGGTWEARVDGDGFHVSAEDRAKGLAIDLALAPERPPVLEGPGGLSRKSDRDGFASLYYSVTRLASRGTLRLDGRTWRVRGESWMDREFGSSQLAPDEVGWDWFAIRLRDGRDLMLYLLRGADGRPRFRSGTVVGRDGRPAWLGPGDFRVAVVKRWRSPGGAEYPVAWDVEVGSAALSLYVEAAAEDQENRGGRGPVYWEGAVDVFGPAGEPAGEGYAELTGYGNGTRPPI
ncbi:MAG TPA: lipocalin-like domain-containing protein [Anaeromyxobacteraceae bacterium]|nr:lipocalin-like domain-containing protein [Anaeromyxobacteraceae bacterium]